MMYVHIAAHSAFAEDRVYYRKLQRAPCYNKSVIFNEEANVSKWFTEESFIKIKQMQI